MMEALKDKIFKLELEIMDMRKAEETKWKQDKLDIVKAHLEIAGSVCLHILYPDTDPVLVMETNKKEETI